ncbi:hypothetical protein PCI56_23365 [Plesiomonas shigelloides subsp. oncorhynchi]|nr:hypothetical protein [Plesiomonas shigelloides]
MRMPVATLNKGQSIDVDVQQPGLYQVRFGNAQGDITAADVRILQKTRLTICSMASLIRPVMRWKYTRKIS